jgi:aspartokinase/homoserine dehydrogenase 1
MDEEMEALVQKASTNDCVLRYVARIEGDLVSVGIESVPRSSPLGRLRGTDNQVTLRTKRYDSNPLIVTGPGAGAEVTAAGVLNDIVAIATAADYD